MDHFFHNAYTAVETDNSTFNNDQLSSDVLDSITLHSIKSPSDFYHTDNFMHSRRILELRHRYNQLSTDTRRHQAAAGKSAINDPLFERHFPEKRCNVHEHDMFDNWQMFSRRNENPRRGLDGYWKRYLYEVKRQVNKEIYTSWVHRQSNESLPISVKDIQYGFIRQHPLMGVDLVLQLQMPVKRRFLMRNRYTGILFREDNMELAEFLTLPEKMKKRFDFSAFGILQPLIEKYLPLFIDLNATSTVDIEGITDFNRENLTAITQASNHLVKYRFHMHRKIVEKTINFIMPVKGGWDMLKEFLKNLERVLLADYHQNSFSIIVVLFENDKSPLIADPIISKSSKLYKQSELILMLFEKLKSKYSKKVGENTFRLIVREDVFSRSVGCSAGAALLSPDDLLFFIDVDMMFTNDLLIRIRANTVQYKRVYYPIVFKDYYRGDTLQAIRFFHGKSNITLVKSDLINHFAFQPDDGFWVYFAYGMVSVYKCDLQSVGGFNTSIAFWDHEDIDLHKKFVNSNLTIFSAVDPGLVHIFHNMECSHNLSDEQMQKCVVSKTTSIASQRKLAHIAFSIIEPPKLANSTKSTKEFSTLETLVTQGNTTTKSKVNLFNFFNL